MERVDISGGSCGVPLQGIPVPRSICCWSPSRLQRAVWACCYKPHFHSWPTQRHKMKAQRLVCGHPLGEITREQASRAQTSSTDLPLSWSSPPTPLSARWIMWTSSHSCSSYEGHSSPTFRPPFFFFSSIVILFLVCETTIMSLQPNLK